MGPDMNTVDSLGLPLVSILIVTWNRRNDLVRSIESALAQTYSNKEIIVVDNGSCDGTADMVIQNYPQVQLIRLERNVGCASGRNIGLSRCRGKYVYQLDDDGWLKEDAVEISVRQAEADASIGVVMSSVHEVDDGRVVRIRPVYHNEPVYQASFSGGCSLIRRDMLREVGYYPEDFFRQGEENDLAIRMLDAGYFCFLEPASVMYHAPSPIGRNEKAAIYYALRNTNKTGLRLWPFPWCILRVLVNMGHAFRYMFAMSYPALPILVLGNLFVDLCTLRGQRKPVSQEAYRVFRRLRRRPSANRPEIRGRCQYRQHALQRIQTK